MRNRATVIRSYSSPVGPRTQQRTAYPHIEHIHKIFTKEQPQKLYPRYENWLGTHKTIIKKAA